MIEPVLDVAVTFTEAAELLALPSLTVRLSTYTPATSGVNVGLTTVELDSVALLLTGFEVNDQL